jgi:hypothetical protein
VPLPQVRASVFGSLERGRVPLFSEVHDEFSDFRHTINYAQNKTSRLLDQAPSSCSTHLAPVQQ